LTRTARGTLAAGSLVLLAACAQSYQPIIDTKGVDQAKYQQDLYECRQYAEQVSPAGETAKGALIGAALGAAAGAATGAIAGNAGTGAAIGAAGGGIVGGGAGAYSGVSDQKEVIRRCLAGRGYSVLQ
jgi:hypothetical protein